MRPRGLPFRERDTSLSYSLRDQTVGNGLLILLAVALPLCLMTIGHVVLACRARLPLRTAAASWALAIVAFASACVTTIAVIDVIKNVTGRQRPNFFALCDYAGFRAAAATSNFSAYFNATSEDAIGRVSRCGSTQADVYESQRSFPSGHSSLAFCGLGFLTLYARRALCVKQGVHFSVEAIAASSPLVLATWICVTRIRDRWHFPEDVLCAAIIGAAAAWIAWRHYVAHGRHAPVMAMLSCDGSALPPVISSGNSHPATTDVEQAGASQTTPVPRQTSILLNPLALTENHDATDTSRLPAAQAAQPYGSMGDTAAAAASQSIPEWSAKASR